MLVACLSILEGAPVEARPAPEKTWCHIEEGAAPGLVTLNPIQTAPPAGCARPKLAHAAGDKEGGGRWSGGGAQEWRPQPDPHLEARMQGDRGSGGGARRARGWSGVAARVWGRGGEHEGGRRSGGGTIGERKEEARGDSARMRCGGGVRWRRGRADCGGWGRVLACICAGIAGRC
jgi:hypothetical protein